MRMLEKEAPARAIEGMVTGGYRGLYAQLELSQLKNKFISTCVKGKESLENLNYYPQHPDNHRVFERLEFQYKL